jgi:hypothetical protein
VSLFPVSGGPWSRARSFAVTAVSPSGLRCVVRDAGLLSIVKAGVTPIEQDLLPSVVTFEEAVVVHGQHQPLDEGHARL